MSANKNLPYVTVTAEQLNGQHIGRIATFTARVGSTGPVITGGVSVEVAAELRQVYHTSAETVIHVSSEDQSLVEFVLDPGSHVELRAE